MPSLLAALPRRRAAARAAALRAEIEAKGLDAGRARALADALERAGAFLGTIEALTAANRLEPDAHTERRLIRLRRRAFPELAATARPAPRPIVGNGAFRGGVPTPLAADALTADVLRAGIADHGCVWVRGLVPADHVQRLRAAIDRAFAAREARMEGRARPEDAAWFDPMERVPKDGSRHWVRLGQGLLAADSPRAFFAFTEMLHALRFDRLVADYLGERPALSVEKCVLRRADASLHRSAWHQDGAFLGRGIHTLDAWFALSPCGRDAPGLDVLPVRLDRILPTGDGGTYFDWTTSPETVARELPGVTVWRPAFEAGDALLFDHLLVHRTAAEADMPGIRYAIESWWFAPSVYPRDSTPLVV